MSPYLALLRLNRLTAGTMLDIGARDCRISRQFASLGYTVDALEPFPLPDALDEKKRGEAVTLHRTRFEDFRLAEPYDLVIASLVSQHIRCDLPQFLARLKFCVKPDGLIYVTLFGDADDWAVKPMVKAVSADRALQIIAEAGLNPIYRTVEEYDGPDYAGAQKHWHLFGFVLEATSQSNI